VSLFVWLTLMLLGGIINGYGTRSRDLLVSMLGMGVVAVAAVQVGKWIAMNPP